jgi:hypothetical protein
VDDERRLQDYYDDIVHCLIYYGGLSEAAARQRLDASNLFAFENEVERAFFFHEEPYYYAMGLLHGRTNPWWHLDSALWPPPQSYRDGSYRPPPASEP